jgi:hypothetical protein
MTPKPTPEQHLRKHIIWAHGKVAVFSPPDAATGGNIALMAADDLERLRAALETSEHLRVRTYAACSKAFNLIDNYSGDTDPHDEDHPLLLACQTLADVLAELAAPGEPFAKLSCHNFEIAKARRQG